MPDAPPESMPPLAGTARTSVMPAARVTGICSLEGSTASAATTSGLNCPVSVDSAETGQFNPDVVAAEAVLPSSEHIPVTRAAGITEVLAVPASGGMDSGGASGILGGQASAIHMSGWTISDMLLKKNVAMVLNWPTIETQTFDFSTFSRKQKSY